MHGLQKSEEEMKHKEGVLLDTSFFLHFPNEKDSLFAHADEYFEHYIKSDIDQHGSSIEFGR